MRMRIKRMLICTLTLYLAGVYYFFILSGDRSKLSVGPGNEAGDDLDTEMRHVAADGNIVYMKRKEFTGESATQPRRTAYELCPQLLPPPFNTADRQVFLPVGGQGLFYTFSAFVDDRLGKNGVLIILSIGDSRGKMMKFPRYCQVWYRDENEEAPVAATATLNVLPGGPEILPEDKGLRYTGYTFNCPLPSQKRPYAVSLAYNKCDVPAGGVLKVLNTKSWQNTVKPRFGFAVCVTPLHLHYDNLNQFIEMVEMNRQLGAEHFTFYNYSIGPRVTKALKHYIKEGVVDLIQWPVPVKVNVWPPIEGYKEELYYFGQIPALNDCLHRYLHKANVTVMTDMDEFIVPRVDRTWRDLFERLGAMDEKVRAYVFKNTFFRTEWPNDESLLKNESVNEFNLLTQLKTKRENYVSRPHTRSKYFAITERVRIVGIHFVWKGFPGYPERIVPEEVGLLHHYRNWEDPTDKNWIVDRTMHKYSDKLLLRLNNIHRLLKQL
ncbi:uncharacterized protein LOC106152642 isoform X1 [Lingula anatina]|uniref:Glycosyltransferase family 92 protein n=1 Tax=Lingula anatina TaxID=7574 RepID=A0A1S3H6Z3_LINAN|nr:uncharacterized protein LOC106152642 isoform X1 [Lingula anatina]|eukprot:XP_013381768.1 uncharacterized protein LOC106152642 isoform X1 [Lingula anatina]